MKLLFDARWIKTDSPDGISRYSLELIEELSKLPIVDLSVLVTSPKQVESLNGVGIITWSSPRSPMEFFTAARLRRYQFDAIYSPHFIFGSIGRNAKLVLTVMDFIPFNHKEKSASLLWRVFFMGKGLLRLFIRGADAIASISQTSLTELAGITSKPLVEIPCGSSLRPIKAGKSITLDGKRLLYIGRYEEYKGVEVLIGGMAYLKGYTLVLAGSMGKEKKAELSGFVPAGAKVEFLGRISDEEYSAELARSFATVSASTDEGFGLPVLEAMQAGVPVVCSDIDVFREVGGNAPLYFNLKDSQEFALQVIKLEADKIRGSTVAKGKKRAAQYSWRKSAQKLCEFIESL